MWQAQARVRQQLKLTVAAGGRQNVASAHRALYARVGSAPSLNHQTITHFRTEQIFMYHHL